MNDRASIKPDCWKALDRMDGYLDGTLAGDPSVSLAAHLADCADCSREFAARRVLRTRLKSAVQDVEAPAYLETRLRAHLHANRKQRLWIWNLAAAAAGVVVAVAIVGYQNGHMRFTRNSQEAYIHTISASVTNLMRVGLGDHVHCAVFRKYPKNPPSAAEFAAKIGTKYQGVVPVVREHVPDDFRLLLAHRCSYHNRQFVHVVLQNDTGLLSVVITRKQAGEAFRVNEIAPGLSEAGSIYQSSVQRFRVAAFESRDHEVYVISDLPAQGNLQLMQAMAPALKTYLATLEG